MPRVDTASGRMPEDLSAGRGASLRTQLANLPVFATLQPDSLHELIQRSRVVKLAAGEALFHQGDASTSLYIVVDGAVTPIAEGRARRKLAVIESGDFVGEIGLVTHQPRNATVAALVDSRLLAIDRGVLFPMMRKERSLARTVLRPLRERMIDRQIRTNLFFEAFAHAERGAIARQFRLLEVADGTRVVTAGEPPAGLFVVLAGSFEECRPGSEQALRRLGIGDIFGANALLEDKPAECHVIARGKAWLSVLGESRLRRIVEANPRLVRVVARLSTSAGTGAGGEASEAVRKVARRSASPRPPHPARAPASAPRPEAPASSSRASSPSPASLPSVPASARAGAGDKARRSRS
jgi:CRP-like cAMP-binding protein